VGSSAGQPIYNIATCFSLPKMIIVNPRLFREMKIFNFNGSALYTTNIILSALKIHYCLTAITVDSNDITALVLGEQKHYFHFFKSNNLVIFAFPTRENNVFLLFTSKKTYNFRMLEKYKNITFCLEKKIK
jgi:hypothetical protein